jgi:tryptophanyl-tRNA synthetase
MGKPVLVSGIQPSGRLHIGNYLGALKNFVELQNSGKYECYFFIADLHSLTENFDPKEKSKQILELAADYLAAGLDPKKSKIFLQSLIPAHSELTWVFNTMTPVGELRRMTQFKTKSIDAEYDWLGKQFGLRNPMDEYQGRGLKDEDRENVTNMGLFDYPVLMAADVLLYDPKFVPVGNDQLQHLELARTLARKFNSKFGKTFIEPQPLLTKTPRVMSLNNPEKKMSKSQPEGCLFLDDSPEEIKKKIGRAVTDSGSEIRYDKKEKPGVSNLLEILSSFTETPIAKLEKQFGGGNYSFLKSVVGDAITNTLAPFRSRKNSLKTKHSSLRSVLVNGSRVAAKKAEAKITEVKKRVGIAL